MRYSGIVIESWQNDDLKNYFLNDRKYKGLPSDLERRVFKKLQMIDDATCDADLRSPPSNHFEKLEGKLEGLHSIRVNDQWRLIFAWDGSSASQLYIDNHSYR